MIREQKTTSQQNKNLYGTRLLYHILLNATAKRIIEAVSGRAGGRAWRHTFRFVVIYFARRFFGQNKNLMRALPASIQYSVFRIQNVDFPSNHRQGGSYGGRHSSSYGG